MIKPILGQNNLIHVTTTFTLATPITMLIYPLSRPLCTKDVLEVKSSHLNV